jgi:hypothetical protein
MAKTSFKGAQPKLELQAAVTGHICVQISESIQCPFCGERFELMIDTSIASQRLISDCEVCCRPFEVWLECEPGAVLSIDVPGN